MSPDSDASAAHAVYFDGQSSRKRLVTLRTVDALEIIENGTLVASWPYDRIRRAEGSRDMLRLRSESAGALARLEIKDAATASEIAAHCPSLDVAERSGSALRIVFWSVAAACSIVLVVLFGLPLIADRLAPLIPARVEARIGESVDKQVRFIFSGKTCVGVEGQAAFVSLIDKLRRAGQIDVPLDAQVIASELPNAFALPGGRVYLLEGLLREAKSPDEIAGVLAHELGHVHHRDGMRRLIQMGGTSFLFGLLFGDVTGSGAVIFAARSILDASYSREAETDADDFAIRAMHKLGRSPVAMGEFLLRITGKREGKGNTIFSSHPLSEERLARMRQQARPVTGAELLNEREWQALKDICKGP